jgi:hypothetical protein
VLEDTDKASRHGKNKDLQQAWTAVTLGVNEYNITHGIEGGAAANEINEYAAGYKKFADTLLSTAVDKKSRREKTGELDDDALQSRLPDNNMDNFKRYGSDDELDDDIAKAWRL